MPHAGMDIDGALGAWTLSNATPVGATLVLPGLSSRALYPTTARRALWVR